LTENAGHEIAEQKRYRMSSGGFREKDEKGGLSLLHFITN